MKEDQVTSCRRGRCGGVLWGKEDKSAVVLCPLVGTPVGEGLVVFAGGDGDWVDGAVWRVGTGTAAKSSGAWTCWMRRMNCCNTTTR